MNLRAFVVAVLLAAFAAPCALAGQEAKPNPDVTARVVGLLEGSGFRYAKESEAAWSIGFKGENDPGIKVVVHLRDPHLVLYSIVAYKAQVTNETEVMRQLLRKNADLPPGITLYIDSDGDYIATVFHALESLTPQGFKDAVNVFASASDASFGAIKQYLGPAAAAGTPATGSAGSYSAPAAASRTIDLLAGKASFSFDPSRWTQKTQAEKNRFLFEHKDGDGYGLIIAERVEVPLERLRDVALQNARAEAPDARIVAEERRRVNGADVVMVELQATVNGIGFSYLDYLLSGPAGTIQVFTYTGRSLFSEYRKDFEEFLNGIRMGTGR